jgi:hypothetical protein
MQVENKDTLYIPQGIKHKSEKFKDIPNENIKIIVTIMITFAVLDMLIFIVFKNIPVASGGFFVQLFGTIMFFKRDDMTNISVYDQIRFMRRFTKSQKKYKYVSLKEWPY